MTTDGCGYNYVEAEAASSEFTVAHQQGMMMVTCSTCNGAMRESVWAFP